MTKIFDKTCRRGSLQNDLDTLYLWSSKWLLKFNETKCKVMLIGKITKEVTTKLKISYLRRYLKNVTSVYIYLMILKHSLQCAEAAKKASSALGIIKRSFPTFEISSFALLYETFVRSHMEYCVQAWNPYYRKDIDIAEKI